MSTTVPVLFGLTPTMVTLSGAALFGPFDRIEPLGWVHVERVGLKRYDLRKTALPFVLVENVAALLSAA